jgi:hypothetical protein
VQVLGRTPGYGSPSTIFPAEPESGCTGSGFAFVPLADEYDAAQERGEVRKQSDNQAYSRKEKAGPADIGLTRKQVYEARAVRCRAASVRPVSHLINCYKMTDCSRAIIGIMVPMIHWNQTTFRRPLFSGRSIRQSIAT